ncbi:MAG: hypothetical protein J6P93_01115 [Alphaproteobacteria bacterium]|nr:hypothetical protein [Alphaproteobacteria bacterium]
MNTGYYKFYYNKVRIFFSFIICAVIAGACLWIRNSHTDASDKLIGAIGFITGGLVALWSLFKLFDKKAYIEITPDYIKVENFEKVLWSDINTIGVSSVSIPNNGGEKRFLYLDVKDASKYKLTLKQKVNAQAGFPPFFLNDDFLAKKDRPKLRSILKDHFPESEI